MDKVLSGLFGGKDDDSDEARTQRAGDFIQRVESGDPTEGYSTAEALQNYKQVAAKLPDDEYVSAAKEALAKFTPQQRKEFGQVLSQRTGAQIQGDIDSPEEIAQMTNQFRSSQGNPLGDLLGGGSGLDDILGALSGGGSNDIMGAISGLLGGGSKQGAGSSSQASGIADLLKNPIVQSVLAAIAAVAMKKYAGGGGGLSGLFGGDTDDKHNAGDQKPASDFLKGQEPKSI